MDIKDFIKSKWPENSYAYKKIKKLYRFFKKNLRNQMMYDLIPENKNGLICEDDRVLIIAPHPDDEVIACGGIIAKYASQIDVLCINSSGVKYEHDKVDAEDIAKIRIQEFYDVVRTAGIHKAWIANIWGIPPMFKQIASHINDYINAFEWDTYDYIFIPHRMDGHREHRYVGNYLVPRVLKKTGYKKTLKIARYEVWSTMDDPNYFEEISEYVGRKEELINLYVSRKGGNYAARMIALNYYRGILAGCEYAEAFRVIPIKDYLRERDNRSWSK